MGVTQRLGTIPLAIFTDASNNVGIGTSSPSKKLEIVSNTSQDGIKISGSSNPRLTIIDTTNSVQFDALTTDTEAVLRTDTNHPLVLSTNGTARLTIATTGAATFSSTAQNAFLINSTNTDGPILQIQNSGNNLGLIGNAEGITNGGATNFAIRATNNLIFSTGGANPRMTITSGGNVGIGTSSPSVLLHAFNSSGTAELRLERGGTGDVGMRWRRNGSDLGYVSNADWIIAGASSTDFAVNAVNNLIFGTGATERMRITTSGVLAISTTGKTWDSSYRALQIGDGWGMMAHDTNSDGYIISNAYYDGAWRISAQTNVRPSIFRVYDGLKLETGNSTGSIDSAVGTTNVFLVAINGNVTNLNNSYGQISDVSLKKDITPSTPKLDDLMKVNIVNFKFINDETEQKQIGVIAQELEEIFPSMIDIDADGLKSVKYSVFVPMLIKAIQELNAKVSALENK